MNYASHVAPKTTPQSEPLVGRDDQVENSAGGFTFQVDRWTQLDRFLMLGSENGTYYASEHELTVSNAKNVLACIKEDGDRVVDRVSMCSLTGRAPKAGPILFAHALCAVHGETSSRMYACAKLRDVCRIPTHLFEWMKYIRQLGGFGSAKRKAISAWYNEAPIDQLAFHMIKYRNRHGWTHRDTLRIAHPKPVDDAHKNLYAWACGKKHLPEELPDVVYVALQMNDRPEAHKAFLFLKTIRKLCLPRECLPSEWLNNPETWDALLDDMPMTALIRNLGKMTNVGLLEPLSDGAKKVVDQLADTERLQKSRIHPVMLLNAMKIYEQGHGDKGKLSWTPNAHVVDALDDAFYAAFKHVEPTGKRWYIGLDVSGSMRQPVAGTALSAAMAGAAMAMAVLRSEGQAFVRGFAGDNRRTGSTEMRDLNLTKKTRLDDALRTTAAMSFGATDCALPMLDAMQRGINVDVFLIITDNETWAGNVHPCVALKSYRERINPKAKLMVMAMTATGFSIADPQDAGMLDLAGLDSGMFPVMRDFAKGGD